MERKGVQKCRFVVEFSPVLYAVPLPFFLLTARQFRAKPNCSNARRRELTKKQIVAEN
jgi:hypothetical protein